MRRAVLVTAVLVMLSVELIAQVAPVKANPYLYPSIAIISPDKYEARVYQNTTIPIVVIVTYTQVTKTYYSLDGNPNITLNIACSLNYDWEYSGTGTLENLSNGYHSLKVYAFAAQEETLQASTTFMVNTTFRYPTVLLSPLNITYSENEVPLTYTTNGQENFSIRYVLDFSKSFNATVQNTTLTGLSEGQHAIMIQALRGVYTYSYQTTYFSINSTKNEDPIIRDKPDSLTSAVLMGSIVPIICGILIITYKRKKKNIHPIPRNPDIQRI